MTTDDSDDELVDDAVNQLEYYVTPSPQIPPQELREILLWGGGNPILGPITRTALWYEREWRRTRRILFCFMGLLLLRALFDLVLLVVR